MAVFLIIFQYIKIGFCASCHLGQYSGFISKLIVSIYCMWNICTSNVNESDWTNTEANWDELQLLLQITLKKTKLNCFDFTKSRCKSDSCSIFHTKFNLSIGHSLHIKLLLGISWVVVVFIYNGGYDSWDDEIVFRLGGGGEGRGVSLKWDFQERVELRYPNGCQWKGFLEVNKTQDSETCGCWLSLQTSEIDILVILLPFVWAIVKQFSPQSVWTIRHTGKLWQISQSNFN